MRCSDLEMTVVVNGREEVRKVDHLSTDLHHSMFPDIGHASVQIPETHRSEFIALMDDGSVLIHSPRSRIRGTVTRHPDNDCWGVDPVKEPL